MLASYHNHTTFSDGKASLEDMIAHAAHGNVAELGISDHLTLHPTKSPPKWSMARSTLSEYVETLAARAEDALCPVLRLGIELDWFEGQERLLERVINAHPFDFVIGSVHFVNDFPVDGNPFRWKKVTQEEVDEIHREYWVQVRKMAESELFDIAAHLDLPKKFGYRPTPGSEPKREIEAALDALAEARTIVELNTSGWWKACSDAYPSEEILRACRKRGIRVTLSSDAHLPKDLIRGFDRGAARLRKVGYTEVARFAKREARMEPLETAVPMSVG